MQRAAQERLRASLIHKAYYQQQHPVWGNRQRKWAEALPVNLFRKQRRIGGCLQARCYICHAEKLLGFKTLWERVADERQHDGELDLFTPHDNEKE